MTTADNCVRLTVRTGEGGLAGTEHENCRFYHFGTQRWRTMKRILFFWTGSTHLYIVANIDTTATAMTTVADQPKKR